MAATLPPNSGLVPQRAIGRFASRQSPPGPSSARLYWPGTRKAALVLIGLLVVRLPEMYPPLALIRPSIMAGLVIAALFAQHVSASAWQRTLREPVVRWSVIYVAAIFVTIPFALWVGGAFAVVYSLPFMLLMIVAIMMIQPTRETLDAVVRWTVVMGGVYAAYLNAFGKIYADTLGGDRLGGAGMYDPNDLAVLMVMIMLLGMGMTLRERPLWKLVGAVAAVGSLVIALKTGSRGGTIALAAGIVTFVVAQKPKRFFLLAAIVAVAIPLAWAFGPESFRVRTASLLDIQNDYTFNTDAGRWVIWQRGLGYFARRPIIGVGANNYGEREGQFFAGAGRSGAWLTAHNTYLQVLVEEGIVGAIPFFAMIIAAFRASVALWRPAPRTAPYRLHRPEIFAALIAFLSGAVFLSLGYNPLFFFAIALAACAGRVALAERTELEARSRRAISANVGLRAASTTSTNARAAGRLTRG